MNNKTLDQLWTGEELVTFGKYRGEKWRMLTMASVDWYAKNLDNKHLKADAEAEYFRRKRLAKEDKIDAEDYINGTRD